MTYLPNLHKAITFKQAVNKSILALQLSYSGISESQKTIKDILKSSDCISFVFQEALINNFMKILEMVMILDLNFKKQWFSCQHRAGESRWNHFIWNTSTCCSVLALYGHPSRRQSNDSWRLKLPLVKFSIHNDNMQYPRD